jgi:hypothetical protein
MSIRYRILASLTMAAALPMVAVAHHSFSAEFDPSKVVHLEGTVSKFLWVNPHSWIVIDVKKPDGSTEEWRIEGGAPSLLLRRGWTRDSIPAGTKILVNVFRARDGANRGSPRDITFPDGRQIDFGGSYSTQNDKANAPAPTNK